MSDVRLTILGCGSAKPTKQNQPSCQLLQMRDKQFMIDCGEGAQISMQQMSLGVSRLDNIFLSHLHGDHCFGLVGLISTLGMLGRTRSLTIHAHSDLQKLLRPILDYFCQDLSFDIVFNDIDPYKHSLIYEDRTVTVHSIPLKHRVPCCGFLFAEKPSLPHIRKEMLEHYDIPLNMIPLIKEGADFTLPDGGTIANSALTTPAAEPFKYAYCSDTAYSEKIVKYIEKIDCLYHEATYTNEYSIRAKQTLHSTATEAATIAKLAGVKKLIIGHYSARINDVNTLLEEAKQIFPNTELGVEKKIYRLK